MQASISNELTGRKQVRAIGMAYRKFALENVQYFALMNQSDSKRHACAVENKSDDLTLQEENENGLRILIESIMKGQADGSIRKELDAFTLAIQLWATLRGLLVVQIFEQPNINILAGKDFDEIVFSYLDLLEVSMKN